MTGSATAPLWDLAEALVDHDQAWSLWRARHVLMAERQIGTKPGTGGSAGGAYLRSRMDLRFYPELWELRGASLRPAAPRPRPPPPPAPPRPPPRPARPPRAPRRPAPRPAPPRPAPRAARAPPPRAARARARPPRPRPRRPAPPRPRPSAPAGPSSAILASGRWSDPLAIRRPRSRKGRRRGSRCRPPVRLDGAAPTAVSRILLPRPRPEAADSLLLRARTTRVPPARSVSGPRSRADGGVLEINSRPRFLDRRGGRRAGAGAGGTPEGRGASLWADWWGGVTV